MKGPAQRASHARRLSDRHREGAGRLLVQVDEVSRAAVSEKDRVVSLFGPRSSKFAMVSAVPLATMYFSVFEHRPMLVGVTLRGTVSPNFPPPSATMIVPASFDAAPPAPVDPPNPVPPAPEARGRARWVSARRRATTRSARPRARRSTAGSRTRRTGAAGRSTAARFAGVGTRRGDRHDGRNGPTERTKRNRQFRHGGHRSHGSKYRAIDFTRKSGHLRALDLDRFDPILAAREKMDRCDPLLASDADF